MDEIHIKKILEKSEANDLELKESLHSDQDISKVICSLTNTDGGLIIFGVNKKGVIIGLKGDLDQLQQKISAAGQTVSPAPLMNIETATVDGKHIIITKIHKTDNTNAHTFGGAIYVRMGSTNRKLEGQTMIEFLKNRHILCFDELTSKAKAEDIDKEKIQTYLSKRSQEDYLKSHSIKEFLLSMSLASENGELKIKNATALSFAKNPQMLFHQSEVKVVKFRGTEPIDVAAHQVLDGSPSELIEKTYAFVLKNISRQLTIMPESPQRKDIYEYPPEVIREAIINAIAHRDYFNFNSIQLNLFDDRIEITNPGSIPHGLTKELFGTISVQRNPLTYRLLKDTKYIEGLGIGVPRMINGMRKAGLSDPEFFWTDSFFRITLKNIKSKMPPIEGIKDLNQRQLRAIEYLRNNKTIKTQHYAEMNKISNAMALIDIAELIKFKYIQKHGQYRGAYYTLNESKFQQKEEK